MPSPALQQAVRDAQENFAKKPFLQTVPLSGAVKSKVSVEQSRIRSTVSNTREDTRDPDVSGEAWKAAHALCGLWKVPVTAPVLTYLEYLASKKRLPDMAELLAPAKKYLAETAKPLSLAQWLRDTTWRSGNPGESPRGALPERLLNAPVQAFGRMPVDRLTLMDRSPATGAEI